MAGQDCKGQEPDTTFRKGKLSPDDQSSARHWVNTHRVNSVEIQSSANFLSMNSAGQISISSSSSLNNENPSSTIVTLENLKEYAVSTQSSNCVAYIGHVSSKSDISSETGPLLHREVSIVNAVKSEGRQKHRTESSCSNSISITLPVSSSNESYMEMSTEIRSAKLHSLDAKGTDEKTDISRAASEGITMTKENNGPAVDASFFHFAKSGKSSCLTETTVPATTLNIKFEGNGSSYMNIVDQELMKKTTFWNPHHPLKATHHPRGLYELNGLNHGGESMFALSAKGHPDLFDLNEDSKEFNSHVQSTCETGKPFNVIRVLAIPGVPLTVPMTGRKLEGGMSWKGPAATSAFRPTNLKIQASQSDCSPTDSKGFIGFDLNVAAIEDDAETEWHLGVRNSAQLSLDPSFKGSRSKAERLNFDLNCHGDMFQGASLPATSVKTGIADSNTNEGSSSVDRWPDGHWKNNPSQHIAKVPVNSHGISVTTYPQGDGLNVVNPAYWSDLGNIQFYSQSQIQPFLMTSPNALPPPEQMQKLLQIQPKLPDVIPSLPPQNYPSGGGPFFVCANGLVTSNIHYPSPVQYTRDPLVHAAFPQIFNSTMVPSVSGGPRLMQMVHGHGSSQDEVENNRPCMVTVHGGISALNGTSRDTRQYFPSNCSSVEGQRRMPPKRTEPEGGHEGHQLCTRQLTSWN